MFLPDSLILGWNRYSEISFSSHNDAGLIRLQVPSELQQFTASPAPPHLRTVYARKKTAQAASPRGEKHFQTLAPPQSR